MLDAILEYAMMGRIPTVFTAEEKRQSDVPISELPKRMERSNLNQHSKVLELGQEMQLRPLPSCPTLDIAEPNPLNETAPEYVSFC